MKDLYSVTLSAEQVLAACEQYVLRQTNDLKLGATGAHVLSMAGEKEDTHRVNVSVFVKRVRKPKAAA